jgi:glycosyl transferase family 87
MNVPRISALTTSDSLRRIGPNNAARSVIVTRATTGWRRTGAILVLLAFACGVAGACARTFWDVRLADEDRVHYGMTDFRDAVYYPLIAVRDGNNPYDVPSYRARYPIAIRFPLYAPITLVLHAPLAVLSPRQAEYVYFTVNVVLLLVLAWLSLRLAGMTTSTTRIWAVAAVIVLSQPGQMALFLGQSTLWMVISTYIALSCARSRPWLAAAGLAIACAKPTFGLPAAVLMAWRGEWRVVCAGLVTAAIISLAVVGGLLIPNAGGTWAFIESVRHNFLVWGNYPLINVTQSYFRIDMFVILGRLVGRPLSAVEDLGVAAVVFTLGGWLVRRLAQRDRSGSARLSSSLICLLILAGSYHQVYDTLLLTLPVLTVASDSRLLRAADHRARRLLLGLLLVPAANYLVNVASIERLRLQATARLVVTSADACALVTSLILWGVLTISSEVTHGSTALRAHCPSRHSVH